MNLKINAYAKINLVLDVLNKREDGYHNIASVMQTVTLCDIVTLYKIDSGIIVNWNANDSVDNQNTAYRAARLMFDKYSINEGINISIDKRIPISAGLGGGSADAAAVIEGINELFGLGLTVNEMAEIGAEIGADVPFSVHKGAAVAEGIGEKLSRIDTKFVCHTVLVKPPVSVSTKLAYEKIDSVYRPSIPGTRRTRLAAEALTSCDLIGLGGCLFNAFELVTSAEHPIVLKLKEMMAEHGADCALMSGSGPSIYGLFEDKEQSERVAAHFRSIEGIEVHTCEFYYP